MTTPVKLKLLPRSTLKARNITRLVGQVTAGDGATVTKENGNFVVSLDGSAFQPLDGDLTGLAAISGTGLVSRTASNTYATRAITETSGETAVTNGGGVAAAPVIALADKLDVQRTSSAVVTVKPSDFGAFYHRLSIPSDGKDVSGLALGNQIATGLLVEMYPNNGAKGLRNALTAVCWVPPASTVSTAGDWGYCGALLFGKTDINLGGTNTGSGAKGSVFGGNSYATSGASATNLYGVVGHESDVLTLAGSTMKIRIGYSSVDFGSGAGTQGATVDAAYAVGAIAGSVKWKNGLLFSDINGGNPIATTGKLIATQDSATVAYGVDFSSYSFSTAAFKSPGFTVNGSGDIAPTSITLGGVTTTGLREKLTANRDYYVRTDGSNSNTGLANTAGGAFLTIQKAIDTAMALDCNGYSVTINVADGTYTTPVVVNGPLLNSSQFGLFLTGNTSTPANCVISTTSSDAVTAENGAHLRISGFKIQTTTAGNGLNATTNGLIETGGLMAYGACADARLNVGYQALIVDTFNSTFSGTAGAAWHAGATGGAIVIGSQTITMSGTPNHTVYFAGINKGSIDCQNVVFSGAATGKKFVVHYNGTLDQGVANSLSFLPGDIAGTFENGAVVISSEGDRIDPQSPWKTYTPTVTPTAGSFTTVSAAGEYKMDGKIGHIHVLVTVTSVGTASGFVTVSLPSDFVPTHGGGVIGANRTTGNCVYGYIDASAIYMTIFFATAFPASGQQFHLQGVCEVN